MRPKRSFAFLLTITIVVSGCWLGSPLLWAANYTWTTVSGGNWSTGWDLNPAYPKVSGDVGTISNAGWATGQSNININVTDITGGDLTINDVAGSIGFNLSVNNSATLDSVVFNLDGAGSGKGRLTIGSGKTLTVNKFSASGWVQDWGNSGTLAFQSTATGSATFGLAGGNEITGGTINFSNASTVNFNQNTGAFGGPWEARNTTWIVGRTGGDQPWIVTGAGGGNIILKQRSQSNPWHFVKVGTNAVDMGKVDINRDSLAGGSDSTNPGGKLFTDASGAAAGGTVILGNYTLPSLRRTTGTVYAQYDILGANLVITNGNKFVIQDQNNAAHDDVTALQVLSGQSVLVRGTGGLEVRDDYTASTGRQGIYFSNAVLNTRGNLQVVGPNTFLNGIGGMIFVGSNVTVQSRNAAGFSSITSTPTDGTFDDFNLMTASLTMDGGGVKTMIWDTASAKAGPTLAATDFSLANFTLGTLVITNNTIATLSTNAPLFLKTDLLVASGSTLMLPVGAHLYFQDSDLSETNRIAGWFGTRIGGAQMIVTPGVGFELLGIPEPSTILLLVAGGLLAWRQARRYERR